MGILEESYSSSPGPGGRSQWLCEGICVDSADARTELRRNQVLRCNFIPVPGTDRLVVVPLGSQTDIIPVDINTKTGPIFSGNTGNDRWIRNVVKLGPVTFRPYAPAQPSGHEFAGYAILAYRVVFQEFA